MRYFAILSFTLFLLTTSCGESTPQGITIPVEYAGALKNIMRKGDLSANIDLATLRDKPGLFALGALTDLKGEVLVLGSEPYMASVRQDSLRIDQTFDRSATLLVYSMVEKWEQQAVPIQVRTKADLEAYLVKAAKEQGINTDAPYPFRLIGKVASVDWHVINWKEGDREHSHEKHISSGLHGTLVDTAVEILGFYSEHHRAVFTHHTTNIHMHFKTADGQIVGHADDLELAAGMQLLLPSVSPTVN